MPSLEFAKTTVNATKASDLLDFSSMELSPVKLFGQFDQKAPNSIPALQPAPNFPKLCSVCFYDSIMSSLLGPRVRRC
jgi:hypothetical protein